MCVLFNVLRPVLNEAGGHGGVKMGEEGGRVRNVTPRAKRDDEGHLQESLNFPSRAVLESELSRSAALHPRLTLDSSLRLPTHAINSHWIHYKPNKQLTMIIFSFYTAYKTQVNAPSANVMSLFLERKICKTTSLDL